MAHQPDLFACPPPVCVPGFVLVEDAVTVAEEVTLAAAIDAAPLAPFKFQRWEGKRLTASYGRAYDHERARPMDAEPLPGWLGDLAARLGPMVGLDGAAIEQALLIRYDPGAGIGWHRDRPQYGAVLGLSLSAPATLRLRRRMGEGFERQAIPLPPRALYRLDGAARWEWEHSIAAMAVTRRSITLRTLR